MTSAQSGRARVGAVAIGRNEGERLVRCLESLLREGLLAVYVDSGSSDGSLAAARARGVEVVELDLTRPFTAARARNAGFARLLELAPQLEFAQFVDGDCELVEGWIARGLAALEAERDVVVVAGQRSERFPAASAYNRLCDMEWNTPVGEAEAVGGDALYRRAALEAVGGFDERLIAGEEPELCFRLRRAGGRVLRLPGAVTLHDAAMTRFSQWWTRTKRSGHAAAEAWALHGAAGETQMVKIARSAVFYGVLAPLGSALAALLSAFVASPLWAAAPFALLALVYLRLFAKVRAHRVERGDSAADAALYARFTLLGKFAESVGVFAFLAHRLRGKRARLIEYK
jgi:GT2 family glycosyltransferase